MLNSAYRTLLSPVLRAQYILTMNGHPPSETDKLSDQAFILEVMDARERMEDAATREEVDTILDENRGQINTFATLITTDTHLQRSYIQVRRGFSFSFEKEEVGRSRACSRETKISRRHRKCCKRVEGTPIDFFICQM